MISESLISTRDLPRITTSVGRITSVSEPDALGYTIRAGREPFSVWKIIWETVTTDEREAPRLWRRWPRNS